MYSPRSQLISAVGRLTWKEREREMKQAGRESFICSGTVWAMFKELTWSGTAETNKLSLQFLLRTKAVVHRWRQLRCCWHFHSKHKTRSRNKQLMQANYDFNLNLYMNDCRGSPVPRWSHHAQLLQKIFTVLQKHTIDNVDYTSRDTLQSTLAFFSSHIYYLALTLPKSSSNSGGHSCIKASISGIGLERQTKTSG